MSIERLPHIPPESMTDAQRHAVEQFRVLRGGRDPFGPFPAMLHSPVLMPLVAAVGEYCRHGNTLGHRATELVILLVARHYDQCVEWAIHAPVAANAGIPNSVIDAIAASTPLCADELSHDDFIVYDAASVLLHTKQLPDAQYKRVLDRFGEQGAVDLATTIGYYATLALIMNVAKTAPPSGPLLPTGTVS
eukprot:Opistho-2@50603